MFAKLVAKRRNEIIHNHVVCNLKKQEMEIKHIISTVILLISISSFGQKWNTVEFINKYKYQEVIGNIDDIDEKSKPDKYARYPNGKKGIYSFISQNTVIPKKATKEKISGTVILKYVVDEKGYATDIEVVQSVSKSLDKASIKVMKKMERWIPGKADGKNLRVEYRQPFTYRL